MNNRDQLTTEKVKKRFNSAFELVNYSIKLAQEMIHSGRGCRVDTPVNNRAFQVLLEISDNKDFLPVSSIDEEDEQD